MKRLLTVQDISCVGKCSLTVALPVISACGVECSVIPTAVLSTHTAFKGFTFKDLTDQIEPVTERWKELGIGFDAIYTGYLGSSEQLKLISRLIDDSGSDALIFVDPVMGDNGRLYSGFSQEFADEMAELCAKADIIVPNLTEACFMLHKKYIEKGYSKEYIIDILKGLCELGAKTAVLTGVSFEDGKVGTMSYTKATDSFTEYYTERVNAGFHGTGDIFSSTAVGTLVRGASLDAALKTAADFTFEAISATVKNKNHNWYGVDFETVLGLLPEMTEKCLQLKELNI